MQLESNEKFENVRKLEFLGHLGPLCKAEGGVLGDTSVMGIVEIEDTNENITMYNMKNNEMKTTKPFQLSKNLTDENALNELLKKAHGPCPA